MELSSSVVASASAINDAIAAQLFDLLPDQGPILILMDAQGHVWPSDKERFEELHLTEPFLKNLCEKIDDGDEPVVTPAGDTTLVATQLAADNVNCGYCILALQHYSPESALANIDLIEILISQLTLIAKLVETTNVLYHGHMKHLASCLVSETSFN